MALSDEYSTLETVLSNIKTLDFDHRPGIATQLSLDADTPTFVDGEKWVDDSGGFTLTADERARVILLDIANAVAAGKSWADFNQSDEA